MGITKKSKFSLHQNRMSELFKALGHPARIAILEFLLDKDTCFCGDLVKHLPLSQSTVSQHLKELKKSRIIKGEIEGSKIGYCINLDVLEELDLTIKILIEKHSLKDECC
jgi:DNA-binding transcriptional ArsR family regulator